MTFSNGPNQPVRFQASFYFEYLKEITPKRSSRGTDRDATLGMNDIPSSIGAGFG